MTELLHAGPDREPVALPAWLRRLVPLAGALALVAALPAGDAAPYRVPEPQAETSPPAAGPLVATARRALVLDVADGTARPLPLPAPWAAVHALEPLVVGTTVVLRLGPESGESSGAHNRVVATGTGEPGGTVESVDPAAGQARALGAAEWVTAGRDHQSVWLVRRARGERVARQVRLDGTVLVESVPLPLGTRVLAETADGLLVGPAWPNTAGPVAIVDARTGRVQRDLVAAAFVHDGSEQAVLWSSCREAQCPLRRTDVASGSAQEVALPDGVRRAGPAVLAPHGPGVAMPAWDARGRAVLARVGPAGAQVVPLPAGVPLPTALAVGGDGVLYGYGGGRLLVLPVGGRRVYPVPGLHVGLRAVAAG